MKSKLVIAALVVAEVLVSVAAYALGGPGVPLGPGAIFPIGPSTINSSGNSSPPLTSCNNGQLDFSVATGCNLTFYLTGVT